MAHHVYKSISLLVTMLSLVSQSVYMCLSNMFSFVTLELTNTVSRTSTVSQENVNKAQYDSKLKNSLMQCSLCDSPIFTAN